MAGFWQFFMIFSWNSLILGQCILGGGWWQKINQRRKKTQTVEFRVAMTRTCTDKGPIFHYKAYIDRRALTVGAISGPHSQLGALLWCHFTSRRHGEQKHSGKADQSILASGGSEHA